MAILPIRRNKIEVTRLNDFHGGWVSNPLNPNEAQVMDNLEVTRDGTMKSVLGSFKVNSASLDDTRILSLFIGQAGAFDFVMVVYTESGNVFAATSADFPVAFTDITGAAALSGDYFSFVQAVDASNAQIIVFSNPTDGTYKWDGTGNIANIAAGPNARSLSLYQNHMMAAVSPNQLHFSEYQDPDTWPGGTNVFEVSGEAGEIEAVISMPGKAVIICREGIFYMLGSQLDEFTLQKIYPNLGTIYPRTAVSYGQLASFLSVHGPYLISAGSSDVEFIGEPLREYFSGSSVRNWSSNYYDFCAYMNQYHIIFTMLRSDNSTSDSFVYDIRFKGWWRLKLPAEIAATAWSPSHAQAIGSTVYWIGIDIGGNDGSNSAAQPASFTAGNRPTISGDGRYVAWLVSGNDIVIKDLATLTRTPVTIGGGSGNLHTLTLSFDGRTIIYEYDSTGVGNAFKIYKYSLDTAASTEVSVNSSGTTADAQCRWPSCSADGRFVAFYSSATNLHADASSSVSRSYLKDTLTGEVHIISVNSSGTPIFGEFPWVSSSGRFATFQTTVGIVGADTNGVTDVYLWDRVTGGVELISKTTAGVVGNAASLYGKPSGDGGKVIFESTATNLVVGDTNAVNDLFVRDRVAGTTARVNVSTAGVEANAAIGPGGTPAISSTYSISYDGSKIVFSTTATNLVAGDTNGVEDTFLRNLTTATTTRLSVGSDGTQANGACFPSQRQCISENGQYVVFEGQDATDIVTTTVGGGSAAGGQIYVRDTLNNLTGCASTT